MYDKVDTLPQRLRYIRKRIAAMTQHEFAQALNVSQDSISRYEIGKTDLSTKQLARIAEVTGVSLDWLILGKGEIPERGKLGRLPPSISSRISKLEKRIAQIEEMLKSKEK